jgi:hypothetical protein
VGHSAWREGTRRAIELLRDLEGSSADDMDCQDDCRDGRPQANVFHGHLLALMATQDQDVLAAFSSVLTHVFGNTMRGGVPDIDDVVREMRDPIPTQMAGDRAAAPSRA